jgi:ribonuclease R
VGRDGTRHLVTPFQPKSSPLLVSRKDLDGAAVGDVVLAELTRPGTKRNADRNLARGRVLRVLGDEFAPGVEIESVIHAFGLPTEWSPEVVDETIELPVQDQPFDTETLAGRTDLRELALVTIDGSDAKDFDDAVYAESRENGWRLVVAIADVSHYVLPGSAIDRSAQQRGTSVYFPGRVVAMLPEVLSNGLCSLKPDVERLCIACDMLIDRGGRLKRATFKRAVMRSQARLTYDEVGAMMEARFRGKSRRTAAVRENLKALHALFKAFRRARARRGAVELETVETQIIFNPSGGVERVEPVHRNEAHQLIEECMVTANVAAARLLTRSRLCAPYRNHDRPPARKLEELRQSVASLDIRFPGGEPEPSDFSALAATLREREHGDLLQMMVLRAMAQAEYAPDNIGHFGLALERYAHFTSPIRRYPDLLVHRAIGHWIDHHNNEGFGYDIDAMRRLSMHCSMTERRAEEASREAVNWLKCRYMSDHVGDVFSGTVSTVTSFGLFITLDDLYVDGFVHISAIAREFMHFDPARRVLIGQRSGRIVAVGERMQVRLVRADLGTHRLDFEPESSTDEGRRRGSRGNRRARGNRDADTRRSRRTGGRRRG